MFNFFEKSLVNFFSLDCELTLSNEILVLRGVIGSDEKFGKIDLMLLSAVAKHLSKNRITQMQKKQLGDEEISIQFYFKLCNAPHVCYCMRYIQFTRKNRGFSIPCFKNLPRKF